MLYYVHTCIAIFFHVSYNPVSTLSINQNNYSFIKIHKLQKLYDWPCPNWEEFPHNFWFHKMLLYCHDYSCIVVGLTDIEHMQSVIKVSFLFFFSLQKIATILVIWKPSDHKKKRTLITDCMYSITIRPTTIHDYAIQNPQLNKDFACLQQLSERVRHNIEEKKSQLRFRATDCEEWHHVASIQNQEKP